MKFRGEVIIYKPKSIVASLFIDPKYMGEYQDGFLRKEQIRGDQAKKGSKAKIYYQHGRKEMELTETITLNNLPD